MIEIDQTLIIQLVLFIGLVIALNKILFKPVIQFLEARQNKIDGDQSEANRLQEEAEQKRVEFEVELDREKTTAFKEKGRIREEATEYGRQMLEKIQLEIDAEAPKINQEIEQEYQRVSTELLQKQDTISKEIAEKILGRSI